MFNQLINSPAIGVLERTVNFTEQRNRILANDIANIDTPGFVQQDVSPAEFQGALAAALAPGASADGLPHPRNTRTVTFDSHDDSLTLTPRDVRDSVVFHDRGARSIATLMTDLAENAEAHQEAAKLLTAQLQRLQIAITG